MTHGPHRRVPTPHPLHQEQFNTRRSRLLSAEQRSLLKRQQNQCPVCFSTRIHVYAERWASGKPVAGCRASNRLFSLG